LSHFTKTRLNLSARIWIGVFRRYRKTYEINKQQSEASFKQGLNTSREQAADSGRAYSGFRGADEQRQANAAALSNEEAATHAADAAQNAISGAERVVGSRNLDGLNAGITDYGVSTSGAGGFTPSRTLNFSPLGGVVGTSEYAQAGDIRNLQDYLSGQEVQKRTLNFA
jgi:hypothetical protein